MVARPRVIARSPDAERPARPRDDRIYGGIGARALRAGRLPVCPSPGGAVCGYALGEPRSPTPGPTSSRRAAGGYKALADARAPYGRCGPSVSGRAGPGPDCPEVLRRPSRRRRRVGEDAERSAALVESTVRPSSPTRSLTSCSGLSTDAMPSWVRRVRRRTRSAEPRERRCSWTRSG